MTSMGNGGGDVNREARQAGSYLRLVEDDWVVEALRKIPEIERLASLPAVRATHLRGADVALTMSFAVTAVGEDDRSSLAAARPVASVNWPPLLALSRRTLSGAEQEGLRRQGVSAVLNVNDGMANAAKIVSALVRSPQWFGANLTRAPLADLLQMLAADGRSGMIWVGCPHNYALSAQPWEDGGLFCAGSTEACGGWSARMHLHAGRLVYAETPAQVGLEAFSKCLALREGYLRVHEVYMAPRRPNLDGSVQQLLISAAAMFDEANRSSRRRRARPLPNVAHPPTSISDDLEASIARPPPSISDDLELSYDGDTDEGAQDAGAADLIGAGQTEPPLLEPVDGPAEVEAGARTEPPPLPSSPPPMATATLPDLLGGPAGIALAVEMDEGGAVVDTAGQGDAESTAAVSTLCTKTFRAAGDQLGWGGLEGWCVVGPSKALYARHGDGRVRLALGAGSDNAFSLLRQVFTKESS